MRDPRAVSATLVSHVTAVQGYQGQGLGAVLLAAPSGGLSGASAQSDCRWLWSMRAGETTVGLWPEHGFARLLPMRMIRERSGR